MRLHPFVALAVAAWLLTIPTARAVACSCAGGTLEEQIAGADLVVTATAIEQSALDDANPGGFAQLASALVYTFAVDGVIKGNITNRQVKVVAGGMEASCGVHFDLDRRVLLLAFANGNGFKTGLCMGSRELAANEVLPVPVMEPPPPAGPEISRRLLALAGIAFAVTVASYLAFRRRPGER